MEMTERLVLTYLANVAWMTCLIVLVTILLAKLIRPGASAYRHALWVLALTFASLLPLTALRSTVNFGGDVLTAFLDNTDTNSIPVLAGTSSPNSFSFHKRLPQRAVPFAPLLTQLLFAIYLIFVTYRGLSLCWAWHRTQMVLRAAHHHPLPEHQAAAVAHCCSKLRLRRVSIASSHDLQGPVVVGVLRPRLILPEWFFSNASEDELLSAVCHELAHVRRHDFLLNLIHQLLFLPISFHPAAMVITSQIERSRELACDDIAARNMPTRAAYARSLVSIAQTIAATSSGDRAGCALRFFSTDTLEERIMNLLKKTNRSDKTWGRAQTAVASCLLAAACLMASAFSIQVARARTTPPELQQFAGTWEGKFNGKTFVTLKLVAKDGKIVGVIGRVNIQMSQSGTLADASAVAGEDAVSETTLGGTVLHLSTKAKGHVSTITGDFEESIQYDMRLTGTDQAELRIAVVPTGTPVPASWKLERKRAAP